MYFNSFLVVTSLFLNLFNLSKIVNGQVCKIMVDKCDEQNDVCSTGCESMCHRNFGVCVTSKGIAYCHCFNKESRKNWQKEFRNKFKQLRDEMIKENQEELERLENELQLDESGEDDASNDGTHDKTDQHKRTKDDEDKVKKSKSKKENNEKDL